MTPRLVDLYPDKAQYAPGQEIGIVAEIRGPDGEAAPVTLHVTVRDLLAEVQTISQAAVATAGAAHRLRIGLAGRQVAWRGYGVDAALECGGEVVDRRSTSFDVADSWRRSPRYGFLADFGPEAAGEAPGDAEDVAWLCRLHLNVAQFYDWMYRHDTLLPPADEYTDPMGKRKSLRAVRGRLAACHAAGIRAIAYGAVYAATEAFAREHLQWALRDGDGRPITFIDRFTLMSIAPDSPWRAHIVEQFARAISELGFDGIHLDAYGFPKTATSLTSGAPRVERLQEHFPALIDATRQRLPDAGLIFNNVSGWPVSTTAPAGVDAVYIEVWPPAERYGHVVEIIHQARVFGGGKPVILAAYLAPFARPEPGALAAFQLLWAVIAAHGASQLVLGGHQGVLVFLRDARAGTSSSR